MRDGPTLFTAATVIFFAGFSIFSPLHAQTLPGVLKVPENPPPVRDPLHRLSPQSSTLAFLDLCREGKYDRAAKYINLDRLRPDLRLSEGPQLAKDLGAVLDRDAQFDVAALSTNAEGDLSDSLPPERDRLRSYDVDGQTQYLQMERVGARAGLMVWVFAPDTVNLIPRLKQMMSDSPIEKYLPPLLVSWNVCGVPIWRWIAIALLAIVVAALSRTLSRILLLVLRPISHRLAPRIGQGTFEQLLRPLQLLVGVTVFRAGIGFIILPAIFRLYLGRGLTLITWIGITWLLFKTLDIGTRRLRTALEARHSTFSRSALPMTARIVKAALLVFAVTAILGDWGYNTTTILAGLGIGGIAVALAAQKTIENLFGGVAVISDRPVAVGDFCKFGDKIGTVEDIGLRSTRIRTLDRTLVTVPNGEFSAMVLENFAWRDKIWFHPTLNLRRDTTPDQVRRILEETRRILTTHPNVDVGSIPVRFVGPGNYSLDIEIFAYIRTADYDEFLKAQQELLLLIMDAVAAAGTALALPTQASIYYSQRAQDGGQEAMSRENENEPAVARR